MKKARLGSDLTQIDKYLGIDFGQVKIGLALADEETKMAFALDIWQNNQKFWSKIQDFCQKEKIKKIIIGQPFYQINPENSEAIENFGKKIQKITGLDIEMCEEMFSTKMAQAGMREKGLKKVSKDDAQAARIILQSWLDKI